MTMRLWVVVALAVFAAVPANAIAGDHHGKHKSNAAKECKAERGTTDASREAFAKKYGTKRSNYKNAFGKCVSQHAKKKHHKRKHHMRKHHKPADHPKHNQTHHRGHKGECAPGKPRP